MDVRTLVLHILVLAGAFGLCIGGLLVLTGHPRACVGLLFGTGIGVMNQAMLALRVSRIGQVGSHRQTLWYMQAGTAMRFAMIGLAAILALRLPGTMSFFAMVAGLLLTMVIGQIVGIRQVLRS